MRDLALDYLQGEIPALPSHNYHFVINFFSQEIVMLILATDMARHSEIVERFKSKLDTFDFSNDDYVSSVSE